MPKLAYSWKRHKQTAIAAMRYRYSWKNNEKRATLYGRSCRVVARLAQNSAVVEFENGQRECVSRNALRKLPVDKPPETH